MKAKKIMLLTFIGLITTFTSCKKQDLSPIDNEALELTEQSLLYEDYDELVLLDQFDGCYESFDLIAGQNYDAGSVIVSNDQDSIYVTYYTSGDWVLNETHLFVGDINDLPTNNSGNPQIGQFPHNEQHNGITTITIAVPIDHSIECYAIAAHASVSLIINGILAQSETAWSNGNPIHNGGSWAMYNDYCLMDCCESETISVPYYAGQDIGIGNLEVSNDEDYLYVTYNLEGDWYLSETHLFIGEESQLPTNGANTPIPGHFPFTSSHQNGVQTFTYNIPLADLPECYIIAAHAAVEQINDEGQVISTETGWSFGVPFPNTNRWGWFTEYCTQTCY